MPHKNVHIAQAQHNEELAAYLFGRAYPDWIVTSMFYAALHYVEAYFDTMHPPIHCRKHIFREKTIEHTAATTPIYDEYRNLKDLSERARYFGDRFSIEEVKTEVLPSLRTIKAQLKPFLQ